MNTSAPFKHVPVLLQEVVAALAPKANAVIVDGTFGGGGYARAILEAAPCRVIGLDRDPAAVARGRAMAGEFGDRLDVVEGCFGDMDRLLDERGIAQADGVALDLGISSFQIDDGARGFSFRHDGPLDMRMGANGASAADLVNSAPEPELANIIHRLGEEPRARAVARAIVKARAEAPIMRTRQLAEIVARVVRAAPGRDPATRTFQALRMHVNDELGELERGLEAAERVLRPSGRFAVVTFHSLEDRMVKRFFDRRSGRDRGTSRHLPPRIAERAPTFKLLFSGHQGPGEAEAAANPRARSAKLRAAERLDAPAWGDAA